MRPAQGAGLHVSDSPGCRPHGRCRFQGSEVTARVTLLFPVFCDATMPAFITVTVLVFNIRFYTLLDGALLNSLQRDL